MQSPTLILPRDQQRTSVTHAKKSLFDHRRRKLELLKSIIRGIAHILVQLVLDIFHAVAPAQEACERA